jgi:regulator of replication initiation timing
LNSINENLQLRKQAVANLESEVAKYKQQLEAVQKERDILQHQQDHYSLVDEENSKLRRDNYLIIDQNEQQRIELEEMKAKLNKFYEENHQLKTQYEQLKSRLAVLKEIDRDISQDTTTNQSQAHRNNILDISFEEED